jgi:hypothetical protein
VDRVSSVGIANHYDFFRLGIESRCGRGIAQPPRAALGPTQLPIQFVPSVSGGKIRRRDFDHPTHLAPRLGKV